MEQLIELLSSIELKPILPVGLALLTVFFGFWMFYQIKKKLKPDSSKDNQFKYQLIQLILGLSAAVLIILTLPIENETKKQLLGLVSVIVTGVIALSSTTLVANILAGFMLRSVGHFKGGDFIRIDQHFGRVTDRGLFHVEIQTEERDLMTLPNLYLMSQPTVVIHPSGTIVSATVSLGYDVPHTQIESLLLKAAELTELQDAFCHITDLGDYSVNYRIAGFLPEVKSLLSTRSNLRKAMLDCLHQAGVEIVSPTFMNQRQQPPETRMIPKVSPAPASTQENGTSSPEDIIFDKGEEAAKLEFFKEEYGRLKADIEKTQKLIAKSDEPGTEDLETRLTELTRRKELMSKIIKRQERLTKQ